MHIGIGLAVVLVEWLSSWQIALQDFLVLLFQGVHVLGELQEVSFEGSETLLVRCIHVELVGGSTIVVADTFGSCVQHLVFC